MARVLATEIRAGNLIEWEKRVWRVLKSYHVHVGGRGGAFMQVEMKDIESGTKNNQRFRTDEKIERAFVEGREMQYLYADGDSYVFMDKENYEQLVVGGDVLDPDQARWLQDGMEVQVSTHEGAPVGVTLPKSVVLPVIEADAVVRGQTASSSYKPAVVEGGIKVMVPPHIGVGTKLVINTEDGSYMERSKD